MNTKIILIGFLFCILSSCRKNTILDENYETEVCAEGECKPLVTVAGGLFKINSSILPNGNPYVSISYVGDQNSSEVEYAIEEARDFFPAVFVVRHPDGRIQTFSTARIWGEVLIDSSSLLFDKAYYNEESKEGDSIAGYAPLVIDITKIEEVE